MCKTWILAASRRLVLSLAAITWIFFASAKSIAHGEPEEKLGKPFVARIAESDHWTIEVSIHYPPPSRPLPRDVTAKASADGNLKWRIVPRPKPVEVRRKGTANELERRDLIDSFFDGLGAFRLSDAGHLEDGFSVDLKATVGTATVTINDSDVRSDVDLKIRNFIKRVEKLSPDPIDADR
jgi:hypothetical protein